MLMCDFLSQGNQADPVGQAVPEDQADQQQSDQGNPAGQEDPEGPVVLVDQEVREDLEVQAVQPRNQAKPPLNPQEYLVVQEVLGDPGDQEAPEVQGVPEDPVGQADQMVLQLLPQENQEDPVVPEALGDLEVPVVLEVPKHLLLVNRVVPEDRVDLVGLEVLADPADLEGRDVLCVQECQEQLQHRKVVRQNLELLHQQPENLASRFHQVI